MVSNYKNELFMSDKKLLLNAEQVDLKIKRLSNEVAEKYYDAKELYIFGIDGQGYVLADKVKKEIENLIDIKLVLGKIIINKNDPIGSVKVDKHLLTKIKNKDVLLIDDVLNSGKTLFYAMQAFIEIPLRSLKVLVLVNRSHQQFPVHPDFVGMSLSTTYENHIEAELNNKKTSNVFLVNKK